MLQEEDLDSMDLRSQGPMTRSGERNDEKTKSTAIDAFVSKLSATKLGYYNDRYLPIILQSLHREMRKQPIINRGYYTRVQCMRTVMEKFLEINPNEAQILNIGAGFDTIAFHLAERKNPNIRIFEADFSDLLLRKANLIVKSKELYSVLLGNDAPKPSLQSITTEYGYHFNQLHLISSDLHLPQDFIQSLLQAGFQVTTPTLIFTECVLVYLKRDAVVNLCTSVLDLFPSHSPLSNPRNEEAKSAVEELESGFQDPSLPQGGVVWLSYDMVHPNDTFGKMMRQNLEVAGGFKVPGFTQYPDLASHSSRFLESGCEVARACTMLSIYTNLIPTNEKIRINRIEMLDEVEEWEMLMSHYCISLGIKGGSQIMRDTMVELIPEY